MKKVLPFFLILLTMSLKAQPPGCSSGTAANGTPGTGGLLGEYFAGYFNDNTSFFPSTISTTTRVESNLNYSVNNWGALVPPATGTVGDPNQFSGRYRGSIYIALPGTYTFYLTSDDCSYLWIDNPALTYPASVATALINNGGAHGDVTVSNTVTLTAGLHNIQILYGENSGNNHLVFEYQNTALGITRQPVPNSILCTSIQPLVFVPPPTGCVCTDPSANPAASGLYAQYYAGYYNDVQTFFNTTAPGLTRIDPVINFATDNGWGSIAPPASGSSANPELYSARWTGSLYIATAGTYTFYLTSDDAAYLWFDTPASVATPTAATAAINNGGLHSPATVTWTGTLTAGFHRIKMHFGENTGNNRCILEYSSSTIARQVVPQNILCTCFPATVLPVELLRFDASGQQDEVLVQWSTASEKNNDYFIVSRSSDAVQWSTLAMVQGAGNTNTASHYQVVDAAPAEGINYYRLQQVDFDGTVTDNGIEAVRMNPAKSFSVSVYPNPFSRSLTVKTSSAVSETEVLVTVTDLSGKNIPVSITVLDPQTLALDFPGIQKGVYLLQVGNGVTVSSQRIVYSGQP